MLVNFKGHFRPSLNKAIVKLSFEQLDEHFTFELLRFEF